MLLVITAVFNSENKLTYIGAVIPNTINPFGATVNPVDEAVNRIEFDRPDSAHALNGEHHLQVVLAIREDTAGGIVTTVQKERTRLWERQAKTKFYSGVQKFWTPAYSFCD